VICWDPDAYGIACAALLIRDEPGPLGPGTPAESMRTALEKLDLRGLVGDRPLVDREMAACCISGLWLRHGFLAESHTVSQGIPTQSGSYWHGIMHRREPDYENAKYWFRRVGNHPVFPRLHEFAHQTVAAQPALERLAYLRSADTWSPYSFIDACQAVADRSGPDESTCRLIAEFEWQLLFDYCFQFAVGAGEDRTRSE
jgi:hypothetical protein